MPSIDWLGNFFNKVDDRGKAEHELSHLPAGEDRSFLELVAVWGGAIYTPATLLVGASVAGRISFGGFLVAFGIGSLLTMILASLTALTSQDHGLTYHTLSRFFFGNKGTVLPSGIQVLVRIGWAAVELALAVSFITIILNTGIPYEFQIVTLVLGIFYILSALIGFDGLKWISFIAIPVVTIVFLYGAFTLGLDFSQVTVKNPMAFTEAVGIGMALWVTSALVSGDWLRYARSREAVIGSTFVAVVILSMFLVSLGFLTVFATDTQLLSQAMAEAGLAFIAVPAVILLAWTTVDNWLYSASLGLSNLTALRKAVTVLLIGVLIIIIASFKFHQLILPYLNLVGTLIPPLVSGWLVEYYVIGHQMDGVSLHEISYGVNWIAVLSWVAGSAVAFAIPAIFIKPLTSFIVGAVVYLLLYYGLNGTNLYPDQLKA
jgi:cytosine permease